MPTASTTISTKLHASKLRIVDAWKGPLTPNSKLQLTLGSRGTKKNLTCHNAKRRLVNVPPKERPRAACETTQERWHSAPPGKVVSGELKFRSLSSRSAAGEEVHFDNTHTPIDGLACLFSFFFFFLCTVTSHHHLGSSWKGTQVLFPPPFDVVTMHPADARLLPQSRLVSAGSRHDGYSAFRIWTGRQDLKFLLNFEHAGLSRFVRCRLASVE